MSNHNFQVLGFEAEITVVIPNDAEAFLPIVIKNGNLYNPENGFKPIDPKPKQKSLTANQQERAMSIINDAANGGSLRVLQLPLQNNLLSLLHRYSPRHRKQPLKISSLRVLPSCQ